MDPAGYQLHMIASVSSSTQVLLVTTAVIRLHSGFGMHAAALCLKLADTIKVHARCRTLQPLRSHLCAGDRGMRLELKASHGGKSAERSVGVELLRCAGLSAGELSEQQRDPVGSRQALVQGETKDDKSSSSSAM